MWPFLLWTWRELFINWDFFCIFVFFFLFNSCLVLTDFFLLRTNEQTYIIARSMKSRKSVWIKKESIHKRQMKHWWSANLSEWTMTKWQMFCLCLSFDERNQTDFMTFYTNKWWDFLIDILSLAIILVICYLDLFPVDGLCWKRFFFVSSTPKCHSLIFGW